MWRRSQDGSAVEAAKDLEKDVVDSAKNTAAAAEGAVKEKTA